MKMITLSLYETAFLALFNYCVFTWFILKNLCVIDLLHEACHYFTIPADFPAVTRPSPTSLTVKHKDTVSRHYQK